MSYINQIPSIFKVTKGFKGFASIVLIAIAGIAAFVPILTYLYFAKDLQAQESIMNRKNTGVILLDKNGKPFFNFYNAQYKEPVALEKIPEVVRQAVIAAEDKNFYNHPGFSPTAIVGAVVADIKNKSMDYGGSTITQQLVKISLLSTKRNILRKYQEVILAQEIERRYTKDQILEMYLNSVYFGEGAFGINQAAETYFGKEVSSLNLAEASLLAAIIPAPSKYSLLNGDFQGAKERQIYVLDEMVENKFINDSQKLAALNTPIKIINNPENLSYQAPHFALMVKNQLEKKYGEEEIARSGFKVKTSIDLQLQKFAQQTVYEQVLKLKSNKVSNGAAVVLDSKSGEILAMVGSIDWDDNQFGKLNITTSLRQPGSAFKPIVYAAALEERIITPATILKDQPTEFPEDNNFNSWNFKNRQNLYKPKNYDNKFRGPVTVRRALANSLNVPSVEVLSKIGIPQAVNKANLLGIPNLENPQDYGLSLTLGAAEVPLVNLAQAFSVFANNGLKNDPTAIIEITNKSGDNIYSYKPQDEKVLDPGVAFLISSILSDNNARQEIFGNYLTIARPAAVKTGTTENYRDALTVGYTPSVTVAVWVGNNDNTPMDQVAGSLGAAPIWKLLMQEYLKDKPVEKFVPPDNVVESTTCTTIIKTTKNPEDKKDGEKMEEKKEVVTISQKEYFLKGTEPIKKCGQEEKIKEDINQGSKEKASESPNPTPQKTPDPSPTESPKPQINKPQGNQEEEMLRILIEEEKRIKEQEKERGKNQVLNEEGIPKGN